MKKTNKFIIFALCIASSYSSLSAWEDHPDRDNNAWDGDRRAVDFGYDWDNRDKDGRDSDSDNDGGSRGTINGPDDSKD